MRYRKSKPMMRWPNPGCPALIEDQGRWEMKSALQWVYLPMHGRTLSLLKRRRIDDLNVLTSVKIPE
jgi:hypothetical protein